MQLLRQQEFVETPFGRKPSRRNEKKHRVTAIGCQPQCLLPALARGNSAIGIDIEENVVEPLLREPVAQCNRGSVVHARVAYEQARQIKIPLMATTGENRPANTTAAMRSAS